MDMQNRTFGRTGFLSCMLLIFAFLSITACQPKKKSPPAAQTVSIRKVVAVCFLGALSKGDNPGVHTHPLFGSIISAEPVPDGVINEISDELFERVSKEKRFDLVPREQAVGVYSAIVNSEKNVNMPAMKALQVLGKSFEADAVLIGYVYRWKERAGGPYAVESAASVSFDLYLIRPVDGAVLWKSRFDKTQKSLSENVLEVGTFVKGGGKWMTAEQLALIGLQKMIDDMPPGRSDKEQ